jgi:hypothetical protein
LLIGDYRCLRTIRSLHYLAGLLHLGQGKNRSDCLGASGIPKHSHEGKAS